MSSHGRTNFTTTLTVLGHFEISSWERGGSKRGEKNRIFSKETNVKILEANFVKFISIILSILFVVFLGLPPRGRFDTIALWSFSSLCFDYI